MLAAVSKLSDPPIKESNSPKVHRTAVVSDRARIGARTRIWHFCHVMGGARIGADCSFGQNCFVASTVVVGERVRVQNNVSLYDGVVLADDVFLGPSCVFTNVINPRATVSRKREFRRTHVQRGATVGANATIICGVTLGAYCFVGAGAVVRHDVRPHSLVLGVPARHVGWVSRYGERLHFDESGLAACPSTGELYREFPDGVRSMPVAVES